MLAVRISASHRCVQICMCRRLRTVLTFSTGHIISRSHYMSGRHRYFIVEFSVSLSSQYCVSGLFRFRHSNHLVRIWQRSWFDFLRLPWSQMEMIWSAMKNWQLWSAAKLLEIFEVSLKKQLLLAQQKLMEIWPWWLSERHLCPRHLLMWKSGNNHLMGTWHVMFAISSCTYL